MVTRGYNSSNGQSTSHLLVKYGPFNLPFRWWWPFTIGPKVRKNWTWEKVMSSRSWSKRTNCGGLDVYPTETRATSHQPVSPHVGRYVWFCFWVNLCSPTLVECCSLGAVVFTALLAQIRWWAALFLGIKTRVNHYRFKGFLIIWWN